MEMRYFVGLEIFNIQLLIENFAFLTKVHLYTRIVNNVPYYGKIKKN